MIESISVAVGFFASAMEIESQISHITGKLIYSRNACAVCMPGRRMTPPISNKCTRNEQFKIRTSTPR
jgi:hypothetical protein